jgi:hypothetical protein
MTTIIFNGERPLDRRSEMSPERSNAYRRVMKTLDDVGPSKLLDGEQQRIRCAADNLVFSTDLNTDVDAREALHDVDALCKTLVESGRWEQVSATKLAEDIFQCGPAEPAVLQAA